MAKAGKKYDKKTGTVLEALPSFSFKVN